LLQLESSRPWFKSWYGHQYQPMNFNINVGNISRIGNISRYYRVKFVSGVPKAYMILLIYIGFDQYLKPCDFEASM